LNEFTKGLPKEKSCGTKWMTKGGVYQTNLKCQVTFKLIEFDSTITIKWNFHVDEVESSSHTNYDMILGRDFLMETGMDICFSTYTIQWNGITIPM
jgi:hypothetical protein